MTGASTLSVVTSSGRSPTGSVLASGFDGKVAIVTGAASGIGRATALQLAEAGAKVAILDRDKEGIDRVGKELAGSHHLAVVQDLREIDELATVLHRVRDHFGRLDILINVAAALRRQPLAEVTEEDWDFQHDVNLKATFFLCRAAGQIMADQGEGGRIVNFTSSAWQTGPQYGADAYIASKAGVISLTRGFARQLGVHGITVNVVSPGQIDTPMQRVDNIEEIMQAAILACPLGRMGQPEEVAAAAVFLASPRASFVSGATLTVAGAAIMW